MLTRADVIEIETQWKQEASFDTAYWLPEIIEFLKEKLVNDP